MTRKRSELAEKVRRFFQLLDYYEVSVEGKKSYPTRITSYRTAHIIELDELLPEMKELANAEK